MDKGTAEWMADLREDMEAGVRTSSETIFMRLTSRKSRPRESFSGVTMVMMISFLVSRAQASYPVIVRKAEVPTASTLTRVEGAPTGWLLLLLAGLGACMALLYVRQARSSPSTSTVATQTTTPTLRRYWEMSAVELRDHSFQSELPSHLLKKDLINQLVVCKLRRCACVDPYNHRCRTSDPLDKENAQLGCPSILCTKSERRWGKW